jgi:uncharacterized membrane protein
MRKLLFVACCISCWVLSSCRYESVEPVKVAVTDSVISYSRTIAPLTAAQCGSSKGCHESGSKDGDFTTYTGLKEQAAKGALYDRIVKIKDMPQVGSGYKLTDAERSVYGAWIAQGFPNN